MNDQTNVRAFSDFLMDRDLSGWDAVDDRPRTAYYTALQRMLFDIVDSWLVHEIEILSLPTKIKTTELLERFHEWAGANFRQHQAFLSTNLKDALTPTSSQGCFGSIQRPAMYIASTCCATRKVPPRQQDRCRIRVSRGFGCGIWITC